MNSPFARIALWNHPDDPWGGFERDAVLHAGFLVEELTDWSRLREFDALVLAGRGLLDDLQLAAARKLAENGALIVSGCDWGLADVLGIRPDPEASLPRGSLTLNGTTVRFFGGSACHAAEGSVLLETASGHAAQVSHGRTRFFAPRVGETIGRMLLGSSVESPAVGSCDGMVQFGIGLHAEDGAVLDMDSDRASGAFLTAHADAIRNLWIETIVSGVLATGKSPVLAWHWPDNAEAVASVAVQGRNGKTEGLDAAHRLLSIYSADATILVAPPGYPLDAYRQLKRWGYDVGLLFVAGEDDATWSEERFKVQHLAISRTSSIPHLVSARPFDGRWWRRDRFYRLVEVAGTRLSLSKGGTQAGTSGYLFGTGHLTHVGGGVFELPPLVCRPGAVTGDDTLEPLLAETVRRHGCYTLIADVADFSEPVVIDGIRHALTLAHQARLPILSPDALYRFEKARRNLDWTLEGNRLRLVSDVDLEGLTLLVSADVSLRLNHRDVDVLPVTRYGQRMMSVTLNLEAKASLELTGGGPVQQAA